MIRVMIIARRWLQLEFESHRHAALARRLLVPSNIAIMRVEIKQVDWADIGIEAKAGKMPDSNNMPQATGSETRRWLIDNESHPNH